MPGRQFVAGTGNYRFGYQGQFAEKDQETGLNHFELREYDTRICRWMAPDPYGQYYSPYIGMGNNPVCGVDPDGGYDFPTNGWQRFWNNVTFRGNLNSSYKMDVTWNSEMQSFLFNYDVKVNDFNPRNPLWNSSVFRTAFLNDPSMALKGIKWGEGLGYETEFMKGLNNMVSAGGYVAMAPVAISLVAAPMIGGFISPTTTTINFVRFAAPKIIPAIEGSCIQIAVKAPYYANLGKNIAINSILSTGLYKYKHPVIQTIHQGLVKLRNYNITFKDFKDTWDLYLSTQ